MTEKPSSAYKETTRWVITIVLALCSLAILFLERVTSLVHLLGSSENEDKLEAVIIRVIWALIIITLIAAIIAMSKSILETEKNLQAIERKMSEYFPKILENDERQEKLLKGSQIETEILRNLTRIYRESLKDTPKKIHFLAGLKVLQAIHNQNLHINFKQIENLCKGDSDDKKPARLGDMSVAFCFLKEIERELPSNGVWFGVTHLTNPEVWSSKEFNREFSEYRQDVWRRARKGDITVFRIYCFLIRRDYDKFKHILEEENESKVKVRFMVGHELRFPPDMSLLWSSNNGDKVALEREALKRYQTLEQFKHDENLDPICGLRFEVKGVEYLDAVAIHDPDSNGFRQLFNDFKLAWTEKAHDFPE
ncbi:MAG TPA: hypothetical protein VF131_14075 [Blastocatellia bacterium]|nr:hypothetical protein [Blastocatellia bacterium]